MRHLLLGLLVLAVSGCTTYKLWTESDADEQLGIVQLSYEYRRYESPQVDERAGVEMARERCAAWGFKGAARSGEERVCLSGIESDCSRWKVVREYRCKREPKR
jgi:hypothetical protein